MSDRIQELRKRRKVHQGCLKPYTADEDTAEQKSAEDYVLIDPNMLAFF